MEKNEVVTFLNVFVLFLNAQEYNILIFTIIFSVVTRKIVVKERRDLRATSKQLINSWQVFFSEAIESKSKINKYERR